MHQGFFHFLLERPFLIYTIVRSYFRLNGLWLVYLRLFKLFSYGNIILDLRQLFQERS
jgi:hypothetical protein